MKGMCHTCKSSNVETIFDKFMQPICKDCDQKLHEETNP
jgi:transposase-like protein